MEAVARKNYGLKQAHATGQLHPLLNNLAFIGPYKLIRAIFFHGNHSVEKDIKYLTLRRNAMPFDFKN